MKSILTIVFFCVATSLFSQTLDFKVIQERALNEYPQLIERFNKVDTSLTPEDLQVIYYGFSLQKAYDPEVFTPIENRIRDHNSSGRHAQAIALADSVLAVNPVSIVSLFEKSFGLAALGRQAEEFNTNKKYNALIRIIVRSGDGKSPETAFHVITQNDEFDVIRYFNLTATGYVEFPYNGKVYDILTLKRNKMKMDRAYFDISIPHKLKEKKEVESLRNK